MKMLKQINNFTIWYIEDQFDPDYLDCSLTEKKDDTDFYIDLAKDNRFPVDYSTAPGPAKEGESETDTIYREEYRFYRARKSMTQPMWKLHRTTLERIMLTM